MMEAALGCHSVGLSLFVAFLSLAVLPVPISQGMAVEISSAGQLSLEAAPLPGQVTKNERTAQGDMTSVTPSSNVLPLPISQVVSVDAQGEMSGGTPSSSVLQVPISQDVSVEISSEGQQSAKAALFPEKAMRNHRPGPVAIVNQLSEERPARGKMNGVWQSRNNEPKRRMEMHHVPGHTALKAMIEVEAEAPSGEQKQLPNCSDVFNLASNLVADYEGELKAAALSTDATTRWQISADHIQLAALVRSILAGNMSAADVAEFDGIHLDLGKGLLQNHVWTSDDIAVWDACIAKKPRFNVDGTNNLEAGDVRNGVKMCQGDIMCDNIDTRSSLLEGIIQRKRVVAVENLWPFNEPIKYCFAAGISQVAKTATRAAIQHIISQVPCLQFHEERPQSGTNLFGDSVGQNCQTIPSMIFQSHQQAGGCWSHVGLMSGRYQFRSNSQPVNIGSGCEEMGIVAHEIGHAIGLLHEMSRKDRSKYLTINEHNIPEHFKVNFRSEDRADDVATFDFDFLSLMMYGAFAFSSNGYMTVQPDEVRMVQYMGQRMGFSELDVQLIGNTYGCLERVTPLTKNADLSRAYLEGHGHDTFTGKCEDAEITGYVRADNSPMPCSELRLYCTHAVYGSEIKTICPVSCYLCQITTTSGATAEAVENGHTTTEEPVDGDDTITSAAVGNGSTTNDTTAAEAVGNGNSTPAQPAGDTLPLKTASNVDQDKKGPRNWARPQVLGHPILIFALLVAGRVDD